MATPRLPFEAALIDWLRADADLAAGGYPIHNTEAPPDADTPLVLFQKVDGRPNDTFGQRGWVLTYQVKAVSKSRWPKEAAEIDALIDSALEDLDGQTGFAVSGYTVTNVERQQDIDVREVTSVGIIYHHVGGTYRVELED